MSRSTKGSGRRLLSFWKAAHTPRAGGVICGTRKDPIDHLGLVGQGSGGMIQAGLAFDTPECRFAI